MEGMGGGGGGGGIWGMVASFVNGSIDRANRTMSTNYQQQAAQMRSETAKQAQVRTVPSSPTSSQQRPRNNQQAQGQYHQFNYFGL